MIALVHTLALIIGGIGIGAGVYLGAILDERGHAIIHFLCAAVLIGLGVWLG